MSKPLVTFDQVSFSYGEIKALNQVSFEIAPLDSICIIGPNGGGKSTLLKLMLGLLKPDQGKVTLFGGKPGGRNLKHLGYMPQYSKFDTTFPVTVLDIVLMGLVDQCLFGRFTKKHKEMAMQALEEMGLEDLAFRHFAALSGGQRQRVLIARALVAGPELLLLDEPTANIDPAAEEQFYQKLYELNKRMAIVVVSHDLSFVSGQMSRVFCVNRQLQIHSTSALNGNVIEQVYGSHQHMVDHHHCCVYQD